MTPAILPPHLRAALERLSAKAAALDVAVAADRRSPAELCDGLLVVDASDRVLFADGLLAVPSGDSLDGWGSSLGTHPFALALRDVRLSTPTAVEWVGVDLLSIASVPFGAADRSRTAGRVVMLRDRGKNRARGSDGTGRLLSLAMRVAHDVDEISYDLHLIEASRGETLESDLAETLEPAIREARRIVQRALERALPEDKLGMVDANELLAEVLDRYRGDFEVEHVKLFSILAKDMRPVPGDRLALLTGLRAVVREARASLRPSGGTITLRTWADADWIQIAVSDDGLGSPSVDGSVGPAELAARDVWSHELDALQRAVARFGGRVVADRRPGIWNRVTVMLRRERRRTSQDAGTAPRRPAQPPVSATPLHVLVVDDNPALRSVLRRYLERRGHAVTEAADGEEGLRAVQARAFDRLVLDVQMPHRDGLELFGELGHVNPTLRERTVFVTGGFLTDSAERVIREAGRPYVRKPFDLKHIAEAIEGCA